MSHGRPPQVPGGVCQPPGRAARPTRRAFVAAAAVSAALGPLVAPARATDQVAAAVSAMLAGRSQGGPGQITVDLPASYDYGTTVPLSVAADGLLAGPLRVERIAVFAAGNPFPEVVDLRFALENGPATVTTRIRLNEGVQEVTAVALLADGSARLVRRRCEVAISGCSSTSGEVADQAMPPPQPRVKVPLLARPGELVPLKTMISHWMETGLRHDAQGRPIPRRIIQSMRCELDGAPVFEAELTPAVAANAYLTFHLLARRSGTLTFLWHEDGGTEYHATHTLTVV